MSIFQPQIWLRHCQRALVFGFRSFSTEFEFSEYNASSAREEMGHEKSINEVTLLGRVGSDVKSGPNQYVFFPLATNVNFTNEEGASVQKTEWHRVITFKPNLCKYILNNVKRGDRVYVKGQLRYSDHVSGEGKRISAASVFLNEIICFQNRMKKRPEPDE